ncbi:MAG: efflux RND transporter permease subunit [Candidatus Aureabacteria bacterium]|nr:efflux RND transporter permease subunit [Candidatus Auribacterota bacterium]
MEKEQHGIMNAVVRSSLRFRGVTVALCCMWLGYCAFSLMRAKYDVFPEFATPQIAVQTLAPGLAPEQVEALVTQPIENAVNGVPGLESLRSDSIQGLSVITMYFSPQSDIYLNRQVIAERLTTLVGKLPSGIPSPEMVPLTSSTGDLLTIGLTSDTRSLMELRTLADWTVKQRILAVPGIAKVAVFGGQVKQYQIQPRLDQLRLYNLSIDDLLAGARLATGVRGAGFIDTPNQHVILQTEGQSLTAADIARSPLVAARGSRPLTNLTLGDVARVAEAPEPPISAASIMGKEGVILNVWVQYGANTLDVTRGVEQALEELSPGLRAQDVTIYPKLFRAANFIESAMHRLKFAILLGAILVVAVLFLFLANLRTSSISVTAIPLSLMSSVAVLEYFGFSLNIMTLGGLAIAIGVVVDDAVINVENILRRLRENPHREKPRPVFNVILDASLEVQGAVVYATFAVAFVFVPVLTMSGLAGRLFSPLGIAYIVAILFSLLVAVTVTPVMCFLLLGSRELAKHEPPVVHWCKERYRRLLLRVERSHWLIIGVVGSGTLIGAAALFFLGGEFLPELKEGHFLVHMTAAPGTSIEQSLTLGQNATRALLDTPCVATVAQRVGRAEVDDVFGTHSSELEVDLKALSAKEAESAEDEVREALSKIVGVNFVVNTFLTERIDETLSGYTAAVVVNIFGDDFAVLDEKAKELVRELSAIPGAADVQAQSPPGTPQLSIRLRHDDLARWGFAPVDVMEAVQTAYQGAGVGQVYDGNRVFEVSVILGPRDRNNVREVGNLLLRNPTGSYVRLNQLADIKETAGRYVIQHDAARRVQAVTCNVAGRDVHSFVEEAKKKIAASVRMPAGTYLEFGGTAEAEASSKRDLLVHSLMACVGIILLLSIVFANFRNLVLVMSNLPFCFVGGVLALLLSKNGLSIGSLVGFVTLFGISLRNSIMMISHYEHLVAVEGMDWGLDAALRGASERLTPILMTALVTGMGLLPIALASGAPGLEIEGPMAIVILGGLVTSTALNLLVMPTLALRFGRFRKAAAPVIAQSNKQGP